METKLESQMAYLAPEPLLTPVALLDAGEEHLEAEEKLEDVEEAAGLARKPAVYTRLKVK